jgi:hypothetical protein
MYFESICVSTSSAWLVSDAYVWNPSLCRFVDDQSNNVANHHRNVKCNDYCDVQSINDRHVNSNNVSFVKPNYHRHFKSNHHSF